MSNFKKLYDVGYFSQRNFNDKLRLESFLSEKKLIENISDFNGKICDVGCSTGEFLTFIDWSGEKFGMEISEFAIEIAEKHGISFEKNIETEINFFDVVIFRGTIQHLPHPFLFIEHAFRSLKPGGFVVFLATPNSNSFIYKLKNTLPVLVPNLNFYIPSDVTLINACKNFGFEFYSIEKPYLTSPYSNIFIDSLKFIKMVFSGSKPNFPWPGNMMNLIMKKPL
jgi:SAM-dependent methyltransferase